MSTDFEARAAIRAVAVAGIAWDRARRREEQRRGIRDEAIRAASEAGLSSGQIARAAGLERSYVTRLLSGERGIRAARAIRPNR